MTQSSTPAKTYVFNYKRRFWPFKKSIPGVIAHEYSEVDDKMNLQTASSCMEIARWSQCTLSLGRDWEEACGGKFALNIHFQAADHLKLL